MSQKELNGTKTPTEEELAPLLTRAAELKDRLDGMNLAYEAKIQKASERRAEKELEASLQEAPLEHLTADGYDPDAALEALQILASSVIVEEVKEENLRLALNEIARRFEALDEWMTAGGKTPTEWVLRR